MSQTDKFIDILKSYEGTPFALCGRKPHERLDCIGLISEALKESGFKVKDCYKYNVHSGSRNILLPKVKQNLKKCKKIETGAILLIWYRKPNIPQHMCVYIGDGKVIETSEALGKVIIHDFDSNTKRHIHSIWEPK